MLGVYHAGYGGSMRTIIGSGRRIRVVRLGVAVMSVLAMSLAGISLAGVRSPAQEAAPTQSQTQAPTSTTTAGSAAGQAQATQSQGQTVEIPQRAVANLYEVAQEMLGDHGAKEYFKEESPDFPYPSSIQAQWDTSMANYGNTLTTEERSTFTACAEHLNNSITDEEIGYRVEKGEPNNSAAQADAQTRYSLAETEFKMCDPSVYEQAKNGIPAATPNKPQDVQAVNNADGSATPGTAQEAALPGSID